MYDRQWTADEVDWQQTTIDAYLIHVPSPQYSHPNLASAAADVPSAMLVYIDNCTISVAF